MYFITQRCLVILLVFQSLVIIYHHHANRHRKDRGHFPFPEIPPIVGNPTYNTIAEVNLKLNSNSPSVESNLGCGTLGLLQITVSPAVYSTLSSIIIYCARQPRLCTHHLSQLHCRSNHRTLIWFRHRRRTLQRIRSHRRVSLKKSSLCCRQDVHPLHPTQVRQIRPHNHPYYPRPPIRNLRQHLLCGFTGNGALFYTPGDINQPIETLFDRIKN